MITYLYRCWDAQNQLMYAGIGDDVDVRLAEHRRTKFWWPDVDRVTRMAFPTRLEAEWAEWAVITTCHPLYNRMILPPRMAAPETPDESNVSEGPDVDLVKTAARYAEHILAVTDAFPRWWVQGIPSVRKTKAAIGRGRKTRGASYNSTSTTVRVIDTMKQIAQRPDPESLIDQMRRIGPVEHLAHAS